MWAIMDKQLLFCLLIVQLYFLNNIFCFPLLFLFLFAIDINSQVSVKNIYEKNVLTF